MTRAKRFFIPGYIWHLTSRCVNREFLLKFNLDKKRLIFWLYQARLRFNISILNYAITSNHIHIILTNRTDINDIPKAMQLALGRIAQEYNTRKGRQGPFWQDRYHATAIESGNHLLNCMVYVDFNMVRAGVVNHPQDYPFCGYQEITGRKNRFNLIDKPKLAELLNLNLCELSSLYEDHINQCLGTTFLEKEEKWTSSLAVGSFNFLEQFKSRLDIKAKNKIIQPDQNANQRECDSFLLPARKKLEWTKT